MGIIGADKADVINNIKQATESGDYNKKVQTGDPELTKIQEDEIIKKYIENQNKISYKLKTAVAKIIICIGTKIINKETEIIGIENIENIQTGAIITSNHFNPLDTLIMQKLIKKLEGKKLYIVSQVSNFAMKGFVGFMMNYAGTIPVSKQISYIKKEFSKIIKDKLSTRKYILIYPEEEMWFNYRKPRPLKTGAYYFAAKSNVPIISCFVEMVEEQKNDNGKIKIKHILHILPTIYPDSSKTIKENSIEMMKKDYEQKKNAYESAYNKKLNYVFESDDIAGLIS